jgi:hypothetical protein
MLRAGAPGFQARGRVGDRRLAGQPAGLVSRFLMGIGSPCLRHCVHGASIGSSSRSTTPPCAPTSRGRTTSGRTCWARRPPTPRPSPPSGGAAAVASLSAAVSTETYLCNVCSCREVALRRSGRGGQGHPRPGHPARGRDPLHPAALAPPRRGAHRRRLPHPQLLPP